MKEIDNAGLRCKCDTEQSGIKLRKLQGKRGLGGIGACEFKVNPTVAYMEYQDRGGLERFKSVSALCCSRFPKSQCLSLDYKEFDNLNSL